MAAGGAVGPVWDTAAAVEVPTDFPSAVGCAGVVAHPSAGVAAVARCSCDSLLSQLDSVLFSGATAAGVPHRMRHEAERAFQSPQVFAEHGLTPDDRAQTFLARQQRPAIADRSRLLDDLHFPRCRSRSVYPL